MLMWLPHMPVMHWLLVVAQQWPHLAPHPHLPYRFQVASHTQVRAPLIFHLLAAFHFTLLHLLRWNLQKLNCFKWTFQWHLAHLQCCAITTSITNHFHHSKVKPLTHYSLSYVPSQLLATINLHFVSMHLSIPDISYDWNPITCNFLCLDSFS